MRESRLLLEAWEPDEPLDAFISRVGQSDLLGLSDRPAHTRHRPPSLRKAVPGADPTASTSAQNGCLPSGHMAAGSRSSACLHAARADQTLRCTMTHAYGAAVRDGGSTLGVGEMESYLRDAEADGRMAQPWSPEVRRKVARGLLQAMQDFGLLEEVRRGYREIRLPDPTRRDNRLSRIRPARPRRKRRRHRGPRLDWRLWAQSQEEVKRRLDHLTGTGLWVFQAAGSVVRITWT